MYNRMAFLRFFQRRALKHKVGKVAKDNYLYSRFVSATNVQSILGLLSGYNYALMGGFALGEHGYQRATTDVDILVNPAQVTQFATILNLQNQSPLNIGGISGETMDGTSVDLVAPDFPWLVDALFNAVSSRSGKVLSKPYIVLAKLWAARGATDDMDILQMIQRMNSVEKTQTKQIVSTYMPNEVEDLEQMFEYAGYVT